MPGCRVPTRGPGGFDLPRGCAAQGLGTLAAGMRPVRSEQCRDPGHGAAFEGGGGGGCTVDPKYMAAILVMTIQITMVWHYFRV